MSKNASVKSLALSKFGHYYDANANTFYATEKFARKAEKFGTKECDIMDDFMADHPSAEIKVEKATRKARLSYEMMEAFICRMPDAEKNYEDFTRAKLRSAAEKNPYKYVLSWFEKQFPFYDKLTSPKKEGKLVWKGLDEYRKAKEEAAARAESNVRNFPTQTATETAETAEAV